MSTFTQRYQLFKTVADLHSQGKIKLSTTEQAEIEKQTMDLVRRSVLNRTAMSAPAGFEQVLMELEKAPDADTAYSVLVDFMKSEGDLGGESDHEEHEEHESEDEEAGEHGMELGGDKPPMDKPPMDGPMDGKPKGPPMGDKKPPMGDKPKGPPEGLDELKKEREALVRRAQAKDHGDISDLQEQAHGDGEPVTADEMGLEDSDDTEGPSMASEDTTMSARAKKIKIAITKSGTLVAQHEDHGPVFHAIPSPELRTNREALRRLANRIYGLAVYEGFAKAAAFCNAKLLIAGVDDDVELDHAEEVPPENDPVTADEETDTQDKHEADETTVLEDNDTDTREKPDTVTARRQAVLRRARLEYERRLKEAKDDILDDAENVSAEMKPNKPSMDSKDDASTNSQEQHGTGEGDVLSAGDDVIRNAHTNFKKLYEQRAATRVLEEKEAFVRKFTKAMRVAATRMLLNHDEHPFKVAAVDVLADPDILFSNGDAFSGMDLAAAIDLTELIVSEGHDNFIKALLEKSADLMGRDDAYLADAEADLKALVPLPVDRIASTGDRRSSQRSDRVRREAAEGNFEIDGNRGAPASSPVQNMETTALRSALGGSTHLGRRMNRLNRAQGL